MAVVSKPELIKLQRSCGKDEAVANRLNVSRQTIINLRQRYGIQSIYAQNPGRNKEIRSLFKAGKTVAEIAKRFGIAVPTAYRLTHETRREKK